MFFPFGVEVTNLAQWFRVTLRRIEADEFHGVIASYASCFDHGMRAETFEAVTFFGTSHEIGSALMQLVQATIIDVGAVHHVDCSRLEYQFVEGIDVVNSSWGNSNETRNVALHIQQRVELDRAFGSSEFCPWKQRQAEIDDGRVECVNTALEVAPPFFVCVEFLGAANQHLREVRVNSPIAFFVRIGESAPRNPRANSEMIAFGRSGTQTRFDVAQTLAIRQLCEGHAKELIHARKLSYFEVAVVGSYAFVKFVTRDQLHHLGKDHATQVHQPLSMENG